MLYQRRIITQITSIIDQSQSKTANIRRPRNLNFRIAPDDNGIAMVTRMAPPPNHRFPHNHKRRDLVDHIVHPIAPKRSAMTALMPTRVRGRSIKRCVNEIGSDNPPRSPQRNGRKTRAHQYRDQQKRVANRWTVFALEQLAHLPS